MIQLYLESPVIWLYDQGFLQANDELNINVALFALCEGNPLVTGRSHPQPFHYTRKVLQLSFHDIVNLGIACL